MWLGRGTLLSLSPPLSQEIKPPNEAWRSSREGLPFSSLSGKEGWSVWREVLLIELTFFHYGASGLLLWVVNCSDLLGRDFVELGGGGEGDEEEKEMRRRRRREESTAFATSRS